MKPCNLALSDLKSALKEWRVWLHLGWVEVKQRYRRSVIGPWWISLSMLIFILMMGVVFSRLFHQELGEYIVFFTSGFLFWTFISTSVSEAAEIYKSSGAFITQVKLPYILYVFKHLVRQSICLAHNFAVYILICLCFQFFPGSAFFWVIPGFLLLLLNLSWLCLLLGLLCARFRDIVPIVGSCVQIAFFITPISWMPRLLEQNPKVLKLNPLIYLLDLVRSPLLGSAPAPMSWIVSLSMAFLGIFFTFSLFSKVRARIAYWVD
ncbi:MAG: ABC transporter permease [Verrucomicrobia bacterium]|nr:ABC transporter permease [Verrucomicrobiota bacterium]